MARCSVNEKSWERQPKESLQAHEALMLYISMGADRTLQKVATELSKSLTLIKRWSYTWNWQQRSKDYDTELRRQEFAAAQKEVRKMQERQAQTATLLQKKAVKALDKLEIEDLSPRDIVRFISLGAELERKSRQEAVELTAKESGADNQTASLAETIIAAYAKRKTEGEG